MHCSLTRACSSLISYSNERYKRASYPFRFHFHFGLHLRFPFTAANLGGPLSGGQFWKLILYSAAAFRSSALDLSRRSRTGSLAVVSAHQIEIDDLLFRLAELMLVRADFGDLLVRRTLFDSPESLSARRMRSLSRRVLFSCYSISNPLVKSPRALPGRFGLGWLL